MLPTTKEKEFRDKMAIGGIGYSRRSGVSVQTLAVRVAVNACNDAGLDPRNWTGPCLTDSRTQYGAGTC